MCNLLLILGSICTLKAFLWVNIINKQQCYFFHIALFGNTVLRTENIALLAMCVTNFESLKVAKTNDLLTRNALNQLKHSHVHAI